MDFQIRRVCRPIDGSTCLVMKENKKGICYIVIWIDDSLLVENEELTEDVIGELERQGF